MRRVKVAIGTAVIAVIAVTCFALIRANTGGAVVTSAATDSASEIVDVCAPGDAILGDIDVVPPSSESEVASEQWPTTPEEAAQRLLDGALFAGDDRYKDATLDAGTPMDSDSAALETWQFTLRSSDSSPVALITVEDMGYGAYSATQAAQCAPS